jgi:putative endonuclease
MSDYYVYIMSNRMHVLYIGITNDLERRVAEHNDATGTGFTHKYHLTRLVYFESYQDVRDAIAREKQLKGWKREKKLSLIEALNPQWSDLGERASANRCA